MGREGGSRATLPAWSASVISSSLNCLLLLDEKGDILEFNRAAEEAYGYFARAKWSASRSGA